MPTIPGMSPSPVTIAEIVTETLRDLDAMQAEYATRREEHVRAVAEVQRLELLLASAVADLDHARSAMRLLEEVNDRLRGSVSMLDREVQRLSTTDREQIAALGDR